MSCHDSKDNIWKPALIGLNKLQTGNYIVLISGNKNGGLKTLAHKILIVK